jgi:hypothetical protein
MASAGGGVMSAWLRRVVNRLVTPVDRPGVDDLGIIPGLFGPVPDDLPAQLATEQEIRDLDAQILKRFVDGHTADMDRLLDRRNQLRAARPTHVPVIPGRPS